MKYFVVLSVCLFSSVSAAETRQCVGFETSHELRQITILQSLDMDITGGYSTSWMGKNSTYRNTVVNWSEGDFASQYLSNRSNYVDFYMYHTKLRDLQLDFPDEIEIWELAKTHLGFPVYAALIGDSYNQKKANVLVLGTINGNELISTNYAWDALEGVLRNPSDTTIALRERYNLWFVPMVNPDGNWISLRHSHGVNNGRNNGKNTDNSCSISGKEGVYLANNFPKKQQASIPEVEVLGLLNLVNSRPFVLALSFHSGGNGLYVPRLHPAQKHGERLIVESLVDEFRSRSPDISIALQPKDSLDKEMAWFFHNHGISSFLFSYPSDIAPVDHNTVAASREVAIQMMNTIWYSLEKRAFMLGKVVDQQGNPLVATFRVEQGKQLDHIWNSQTTGHFAILLPSKKIFTIYISAEGYVPAMKRIDARTGSVSSRVVLRKLN